MPRNCTRAALIFCSLFTAAASAQESRLLPNSPAPASPELTPIAPTPPVTTNIAPTPIAPGTAILPAVPYVPAPPTIQHPSIPNAVQPRNQQPFFPGPIPGIPAPLGYAPRRETYTAPVKVSLDDGSTLAGEIHADGPLDCVTSFGSISVPFNKVRGILWRESSDTPDRQATLVLDNNDSLTVTVACPAITVKTTWGQANIELPHVRSLLLTTDKVHWAQTPDGRRVLAPDSDAPPAAPPQ
jgi:hypothetical protein